MSLLIHFHSTYFRNSSRVQTFVSQFFQVCGMLALGHLGRFRGKLALGVSGSRTTKWYAPCSLWASFRLCYLRPLWGIFTDKILPFWSFLYFRWVRIFGHVLYIILINSYYRSKYFLAFGNFCYEVNFISGGEMWRSATYQYIVIHPRHVMHRENSRGVPNVMLAELLWRHPDYLANRLHQQ